MTRTRRPAARSTVLHREVEMTITPIPFEPHEAIQHLDLRRLERTASARIELGSFDAGCCRRFVRAVVKRGMVTKVELDPCPRPTRLDREWRDVLRAAERALPVQKRGRLDDPPIPVREFFQRRIASLQWWGCVRICAFGRCLFCCFHIRTGTKKPIWGKCSLDREPNP